MRTIKKLTPMIVSSVTLMALMQPAYGLGLGTIQLKSNLNQPLKANIFLTDVGDISANEIRVSLAPPEAFTNAGIDRTYTLTQFDFKIKDKAGSPMIEVTSFDPVTDPFLSFIVEAKWASGRVLREYTVLLDPIDFKPMAKAKPKAVVTKVNRTPIATQSVPSVKQGEKKASPKPIKKHYTLKDNVLHPGATYGPVGAEDTLWDIASRLSRATDADVYQTMLAIVKSNPKAFIRDNIHGLKQKSELQLPNKKDIQTVSASEAYQRVLEHRQAWYDRNTLSKPEGTKQPSATVAKKKPQKPLELVAPSFDANATPASEADVPEQETKRSAETVVAKPATVAEDSFKQRFTQIEQQLSTLTQQHKNLQSEQQKLKTKNIELSKVLKERDREIAQLKQKVITVEQAKSSTLDASLQKQVRSFTQAKAAKPKTAKLNPQQTPQPSKASTKPASPVAPQSAPSLSPPAKSDGMLWLWVLLGAFATSGLGLAVAKRRYPEKFAGLMPKAKRSQLDEPSFVPEQAPTTPVAVPSNQSSEIEEAFAVFDEVPSQPAPTKPEPAPQPAKEFVSETPQSVDSMDQALEDIDVYMTYERYEEAKTALAEYLQSEPEDWERHLQLLEACFKSNDLAALKDHLNHLPTDLASKAPDTWKKIQTLLDACLSQYGGAQPTKTPEQPESKQVAQETTRIETPEAPEQSSGLDLAAKCGVDNEQINFGLEQEEASRPVVAQPKPAMRNIEGQGVSTNEDGSLEFKSEAPGSEPSFDYLEGQDEVDTKLSLAKAYIDLGDEALARENLSEVIEHGSPSQQQQAQDLLDKLDKS